MKIAVIGTGNVGRALGGSLIRAGHEVTFGARDAEKTRTVAAELGASAAGTPAAAADGADVIVIAVPYAGLDATVGELGSIAAGTVIIDVTNPLKSDYSGLTNAGGPSAAEHIAQLVPTARVAKAFNTMFASVQADPATHGGTLDLLYATDDDETAATVSTLASSIGFRPVRVGPLAAARELEAIAWLNIRLQLTAAGDWRTAVTLVGPPTASLAAPTAGVAAAAAR